MGILETEVRYAAHCPTANNRGAKTYSQICLCHALLPDAGPGVCGHLQLSPPVLQAAVQD